MEKIKQALEKARAERESAVSQPAAGAPDAPPAGAPPITGTAIAYSQTRVFTPDPKYLRNMKVIAGETDRVGFAAYNILRTQVLQRMVAQGWNALAITSPAGEDGKTLTAVNLAISLARELHYTVLLVDLDLRKPSVHRFFGLRPAKGIRDYLLAGTPIGEVLVNPAVERLVLLPGREPIANSSEVLASPAMGALVQELKSRYPSRFVLFDLPPILSADDALAFAPHVDACLLVLRDGKTTRTEVERAVEVLKNTPVLGTVLNGSDEKISTYY